MRIRRFAAILVVAMITVPAVILAESPESEAVADGRTKANAIPVQIHLYPGETDTRIINTNLLLYDFVQAGDGYSIIVIKANSEDSVSHILTQKGNNLEIVDTWPANNSVTVSVGNLAVTLQKRDNNGSIALHLDLNSHDNSEFYLKFWVKSYGIEQVVYYRYYVYYDFIPSYEITFDAATICYDGVFHSQGTMVEADEVSDLSEFKFYATGLYRGLTLGPGLVISGSVDETDSRWAANDHMDIHILCSDLVNHRSFVKDVTVNYSFKEASETVVFTLKENGVTKLSNNSTERAVAVLANTDLKLILDKDTKATVYFEGESGFEKRLLLSSNLNQAEQTLPTNGAGKYTINMKHMDGSTDEISVAVISALVPINKIIVTCSAT